MKNISNKMGLSIRFNCRDFLRGRKKTPKLTRNWVSHRRTRILQIKPFVLEFTINRKRVQKKDDPHGKGRTRPLKNQ